jgi:hypothetical protein
MYKSCDIYTSNGEKERKKERKITTARSLANLATDLSRSLED